MSYCHVDYYALCFASFPFPLPISVCLGKRIFFLAGPEPSLSGPENMQKINNSVRTHINLYGLIPDILETYLRIKTHS